MDTFDADASGFEIPPSDEPVYPTFEVAVATVSIVDGIWQDQPDNVAAFVEARLGELARGRGNLYICLDMSGEVEGRSDLERGMIEVIRDTYANSRGSISFALSEGLRAANAHLYDSNRQVSREARRMAGASAVILRGNDLYIAQAGPAVVYVEASEKLARFPTESDWFVEDAPMIAPQGAASAPLGIRREFVSDLAHASVSAGDVFVLATRALTQLASTEDLAIAFTERTATEIGSYVEELGEDADLTVLIAELANPHSLPGDGEMSVDNAQDQADTHIESLPVPLNSIVPLDDDEPEAEVPVDDSDEPDEFDSDEVDDPADESESEQDRDEPAAELTHAPVAAAPTEAEHFLNWDDDDAYADEPQDAEPEIEDAPQPVYAAAALAALPILNPPSFQPPTPRVEREPLISPRAEPQAPQPQTFQPQPPQPADPTREEWEAELEARRSERTARRTAQKEGVTRAVGGVTGSLMGVAGGIGGIFGNLFGLVDWDNTGKRTNRFLNIGVGALITFILLLVRLVLPGVAPRNTSLIPRRMTSDPIWLKALALFLPVLFLALAGGSFLNRQNTLNARYDELIVQADAQVKLAEVNPDKTAARTQFNAALKQIREAMAMQDTPKARLVLNRIQDQLSELDGVAVLYFLPTISQIGGAQFKQIATSDPDVFLLDARGRIYKYAVNDASGAVEQSPNNGVLVQVGSKVDDATVDGLQWFTIATPAQDKATLVAISKSSILSYDITENTWHASPVTDSANWGDLRSIANFGSNIYLLDAKNNQIYRYSPNATGYTDKAVNYFPSNALPVLSKAVDMAIDGDIWILNDNGRVLRFRAGTSIPFELGALAVPLKNPVALFTRPEVDAIYIADAGNQRIVEFDKNGAFVRQFKPYAEKGDVFKNLRDFTVNETKRKLYFVNADAAYMSNFPK